MPELSAYEIERQANIARNKALLEQLELDEAAAALGAQKKRSAPTAKPVQPAKKKVKRESDEIPEPRRQSSRLKRSVVDPDETPAKRRKREQEEEALRKKLEEERLAAEEAAREAAKPRHHDMNLRLLMGEETITTDMELAALEDTLKVITLAPHPRRTADQDAFVFADDKEEKRAKRETEELKKKLGSLKVVSRAKVTKDRVYSAAYHPEPTKDLVFFGDKHGQLGIWDARAPPFETVGDDDDERPPEQRENGCYWRLQCHWPATSKSSISSIKFSPTDGHSVYTSAYDNTVRHMSFTTGLSREVFATDDRQQLLSSLELSPAGNEMWVSDGLGGVTHLDLRQDTRKGKHRWFQLSDQKIGCVSLNPVDPRFMVTASNSRILKIWDVRKLAGIAVASLDDQGSSLPTPPPTSPTRGSSPAHPITDSTGTELQLSVYSQSPELGIAETQEFDLEAIGEYIASKSGKGTLKGEWTHHKSVSSAYWDPAGRRIVSTSYDDTLRLWDISPSKLDAHGPLSSSRPFTQVQHNCQTGRWVSVFKAQWSPNPDVYPHFSIGNMNQSLDIYSCKGDLVARLSDSTRITAVQAVTALHPNVLERAVSGNASGRCVLWAPENLL
ncbi:WD40 repeat-like protein [Punctularia strigosozonata HHB-11173 SS5]|uniref:WD40 repeat-like protein n=1 Tax=Punctularia strigosozonata (strain HHB-11173) TaxID=741275 RepID=UPI0004416372|nr:WD40 repeat-like protein [Punctularia strigosozonata HHB-11173 SS5]EIN07316.1 WD40 repeat-like protein [Punctularia strigosozonata HHB-11173 SS5]